MADAGLSRAPDVILAPRLGVIYCNYPHKIAEHGGFHQDDRHVAPRVSNPQLPQRTATGAVRTAQIVPTILCMLGLQPRLLRAVRREGIRALAQLAFSGRR